MLSMLGAIATIFLIMGFGFLARHFKIVGEGDYRILNNFVYNATLPAMIFISLYDAGKTAFSAEAFGAIQTLIAANALAIFAMIAIVLAVSVLIKLPRKLTAVFLLAAFYGNILYMGLPLNQLSFGDASTPVVIIVVTIYNLIIFSIGLALLQIYSDGLDVSEIVRKIATNPLLLSSALGLVFMYGAFQLPSSFLDAVRLLGQATSPAALFGVGMFMYGKNPFAQLKLNLAISATKMLFFPLLFVAIARALSMTGMIYQVSLVEATLPLAITNFVLADHYKLDCELVAAAIVLTTILSPLTVPLLSSL
ncbi:Membrane transport protein [Candidatus Burarchaeum australiense]|nr:Membrane transport protein [Candidatus Burarchaeum australiense]